MFSGLPRLLTWFVLVACSLRAERLPGLNKSVEVIIDRWGVPHIYANTTHDLFFAQGYMAARDRLFQLDLWRRAGTGKLSEVLGPSTLPRDRMARAVLYRGDWAAEWASYSPDTKAIVTAFTQGINAYIASLKGRRPPEFQLAGYDPGIWAPEDCLSRVAGLVMTYNIKREVQRALDVRQLGLDKVQRFFPVEPNIPIVVPHGLDLNDITPEILGAYNTVREAVGFSDNAGSNNWVIDGKLSATGRPMLANDPHRAILIPSLRKTVHLVGPGWNAIGSGEPALPGIAIGHNDHIAFGLTIADFDQQDLYVEKVNPANPTEYLDHGTWKKFRVERQSIPVKGRGPEVVDLKFSPHGPIIYEDTSKHRAFALRWVGSEPGTAGYLGSLAFARATTWAQFRSAVSRFKVPSENLIYADTAGNIGWIAAGLGPIRKNWPGLLPVPGDTGEYEWSGFRTVADLPQEYNPARHYIATANNNILQPGDKAPVAYEWAAPFRIQRVREMLESPGHKFDVPDFERMQQDVLSVAARRFQAVVRKVRPEASGIAKQALDEFLTWDCRVTADSRPALLFNAWMPHLAYAGFGDQIAAHATVEMILKALEAHPDQKALTSSLQSVIRQLEGSFGTNYAEWRWGRIHQLKLHHPLNRSEWNMRPVERPGDAYTVNAASGLNFRQTDGASWREIIDVGDWDRSVMTNIPGESGNPDSPHYRDLFEDWAAGRYHPLPYSRKAVEAAAGERLRLTP